MRRIGGYVVTLALLAVAVVGFVAGGYGQAGTGPPEVSGSDATLQPGERTTVTVVAENVSTLQGRAGGEHVRVDWHNVTFSDPPEFTMQSLPPIYRWGERPAPRTRVRLPVFADDVAAPGTYALEVTAESHVPSRDNRTTWNGAITVENEG